MKGSGIAIGTKIWYPRAMAAKNTSIALGKPYVDFAKTRVESGEFGSTSEVVREAMRRYIAEDAQREALDRALQEGLDSGPARPLDWGKFMNRHFGPDGLDGDA